MTKPATPGGARASESLVERHAGPVLSSADTDNPQHGGGSGSDVLYTLRCMWWRLRRLHGVPLPPEFGTILIDGGRR